MPVVNIGTRQYGRVRAVNVIDVDHDERQIVAAIERAASEAFRESLVSCSNPYGDGEAARRTVKVLRALDLGPALIAKWLPPSTTLLTAPCDGL